MPMSSMQMELNPNAQRKKAYGNAPLSVLILRQMSLSVAFRCPSAQHVDSLVPTRRTQGRCGYRPIIDMGRSARPMGPHSLSPTVTSLGQQSIDRVPPSTRRAMEWLRNQGLSHSTPPGWCPERTKGKAGIETDQKKRKIK